jgi:hypothetical protein
MGLILRRGNHTCRKRNTEFCGYEKEAQKGFVLISQTPVNSNAAVTELEI